MLGDLLPICAKAFGRISDKFTNEKRQLFCEDIASITLYGEVEPDFIHGEWRRRFVASEDDTSRLSWALAISRLLESYPEERKGLQWNEWMRSYWQDRINGTPKPLNDHEAGAMVGWALHLGSEIFSDAVEMVLNGPVPAFDRQSLFYDLDKHNQVNIYPSKPLADLIAFLLRNHEGDFYDCHHMEKIFNHLLVENISGGVLQDICNSLARLGCENALKLAESIDEQRNG